MAAAKKKKAGKTAKPDFKWIALIFLTTVLISALMSFVSSNLLEGAGLALSFVILICIVLTGILFDIIGVAVTAADEVPFHAMASRKVPEAEDALRLIRNAGKVSSFCNDVIGDICGVIFRIRRSGHCSRVLLLSKKQVGDFYHAAAVCSCFRRNSRRKGLRQVTCHEQQYRCCAHGSESPMFLPDAPQRLRKKHAEK